MTLYIHISNLYVSIATRYHKKDRRKIYSMLKKAVKERGRSDKVTGKTEASRQRNKSNQRTKDDHF